MIILLIILSCKYINEVKLCECWYLVIGMVVSFLFHLIVEIWFPCLSLMEGPSTRQLHGPHELSHRLCLSEPNLKQQHIAGPDITPVMM